MWSQNPLIQGPPTKSTTASHQLELCANMEERWTSALQLPNPNSELFVLEPGLKQVLDHQQKLQQSLPSLRARVCEEVTAMRDILHEATEDWFDDLPAHIMERCIQVPLLKTLTTELQWGGPGPGLGWPKREDERYSHLAVKTSCGRTSTTSNGS